MSGDTGWKALTNPPDLGTGYRDGTHTGASLRPWARRDGGTGREGFSAAWLPYTRTQATIGSQSPDP